MGLKNFLWLLFLALLWGPSFFFIKVALGEVPPLTVVTGRVGIGAVLLYVFLRLQGRPLPRLGRVWQHFAVMALLANALPFILITWGELHIDSALAAILNGTTPLFTIVLAHFLVADDRITPAKLAGVLLGFAGLFVLIAPSLAGEVRATTWGLLAVAGAAASYGLALVYARNNLRGVPAIVTPAAQLLVATLYLLPLALLIERPFNLPLPSWPALGSLLALGSLGTGVAFVVYYGLLERTSATFVSMVTYLLPLFGVALGVIVLHEQLSWNAYASCALILVGVMIVNGLLKPAHWRQAWRSRLA